MKQLPQGQYNFKEAEEKILNFWFSKPFFKPEFNPETGTTLSLEEMKLDSRQPWSLICPPPNAYDRPHIGNLSGYAYQDALARFNRMKGKKVIMIPGKDHAGLEGEATFVRDVLEKEGKKKSDYAREEFYKRVWDHQHKFIDVIRNDEKGMGLSADFDRELYTLDEKVVNTVLETFIQMYNDELLYKGVRIVNWDIKAGSTIPDNQCERKEQEGTLYYIKYPLLKDSRLWNLNFRIDDVFNAIKNGIKTIETRALNPEEPERYFGDIKAGHIICCNNKTTGEQLLKKVKRVSIYEDFRELFNGEDMKQLYSSKVSIPNSAEELREDYIHGLSKEYANKIEKNGIIAIELEDLNFEEMELLTVATTRPETMLGDTALVVNPSDERYKHLVGKKVLLPIANREIPIITSGRIEKDFGTGVLKLTPAHAVEDYQIMLEWNQSQTPNDNVQNEIELNQFKETEKKLTIGYINVIDKSLKMVGPIPEKYKGMKSNQAKEEIVKDLKELGLLEKEEKIIQNILVSERTGVTVEPLMTSQWFMNVDFIRTPLMDMVLQGKVKIHPKNLEKKFFAWVENMRDWAISRNLWWGYRLPVWYGGEVIEEIDEQGQVVLKLKIKNEKLKDGVSVVDFDPGNPAHMRVQLENPGEGWKQDEDILDGWFSSGQWPYAVLDTYDLMDIAYPTDVLVSGYDLLVKWDLTMMLFGWYKTNQVPFKDLYLTGLVKGTDGQKMSKSKRNFVPIDDVKELYGTDSFRMNCFYQNKAGKAYAITPETLKNFRNFNNKIWNASKFVMMNLEGLDKEEFFEDLKACRSAEKFKQLRITNYELLEEDKVMLDNLERLEKKFDELFEKFRFGSLTEELYTEFWHTFCDTYIEKAKSRVWKNKDTGEYSSTPESRKAAQATLFYTLKSFLRMLHPFIPFITEEIWQHLVEDGEYEMAMMYR